MATQLGYVERFLTTELCENERFLAFAPRFIGCLIEDIDTHATRYVSFREVQGEQKATA